MTTFTCPRCGLLLMLTTEPPQFGDLRCGDCGATIELHPNTTPTSPIQFAGSAELDVGLAKIRQLVDEVRRRGA